jgi:sugar/nucleoside kinase (ribokinase family)
MFDVVCVGSATEDIFVFVHPRIMKGNLFFVPGSKVEASEIKRFTGGGATNSAVAFSRLGFKTGVVSTIGVDESAKKIVAELKKEKISTVHLVRLGELRTACSVILTGFHRDRVVLHYKGIPHGGVWNKIRWESVLAKWAHVSSTRQSFGGLKKVFEVLCRNKTKIVFNPGKKELEWGFKKIVPILAFCEILFLNKEEAEFLCGKKSVKQNLVQLQKHVPLVVVTCGPRGAYAFDGKKVFFQKTRKVKVFDATGAGDAFNSAFTAAVMKGKGVQIALKWGTVEAESVIQHLGTKNRLLSEKEMVQKVK